MRFDQFTIKAQEAIAAAQTEAAKKDHPEVTPEHLLRALLTQERGVVPAILGKLGADTATLLAEIEKVLAGLPITKGAPTQVSGATDAVLKQALREAETLKDQYVSSEHLLLGLAESSAPAGKSLGPWAPSETASSPPSARSAATRASTTPTPRTATRLSSATPGT